MINKLETGKRIASLRAGLAYSQAAFAEMLNVTPQAVSKWETGATLPDVGTLLEISWLCRISINEILDAEEVFLDQRSNVERELIRMNKMLACPECKKDLSLKIQTSGAALYYECENNHRFNVEDGVVYFNTREIEGELWSLNFRTYEQYLQVAKNPGDPRYSEGETPYYEIMWREIEKLRPKTIVDIACGMGIGIQNILKRINWPCTLILTDLSHRILAWNRKYYTEEIRNPYVDLVFLACDCSNIPLRDNSVDMVFSNGGFVSMQKMMMAGFREARRILKAEGHAVYNMSLIDDHKSDNSKKWFDLFSSVDDYKDYANQYLKDIAQWLSECKNVGFEHNEVYKVYGEMPAPDTDVFPFENNRLRWMAEYVLVSSHAKH